MAMSQPAELVVIKPDWPAPARVRAAQSTRLGGISQAPFDSLNLAVHSGDDRQLVAENRRLLAERLQLPAEPVWLQQVHGIEVVSAAERGAVADAVWADRPGQVCAILSADCLPVLFCDFAGQVVAAAHAGWRGLAAGVLEATIEAMQRPPAQLMAWLGPAIGAQAFEVGEEVRQQFLAVDATASDCFQATTNGRWLADLVALAQLRLVRAGVTAIYGGEHCTVRQHELFYSYRREGRTGRMATLVWLDL